MSTLHLSHSRSAKLRKQYLVYGYINQQLCKCTQSLPMDIIHLIYQFFDPIFYWSLKGDELRQFKSQSNTHYMTSTTFTHNNHLFECGAFPNGRLPSQMGYVVFYISMPHIADYFTSDPNIESVVVYFELFCEETKSQWKGIRVYINDNKKSAGWSSKTLPLQLCKACDALWFTCYAEVLQIVYKTPKMITNNTLTHNHNAIYYKWSIDSCVLDDIRSCNFGKTFFSHDFGHNEDCRWVLMMAPNLNTNTEKETSKEFECLFICLRCIKLPKDMKHVNIKYFIQCDWSYNKTESMRTKEFSYNSNLSQWELHHVTTLNEYKTASKLSITATIHIH